MIMQDRVVPPSQALKMYEAVKQKGLPVSLNIFQGEQHGFIKAKSIKATLVCFEIWNFSFWMSVYLFLRKENITFFAKYLGSYQLTTIQPFLSKICE